MKRFSRAQFGPATTQTSLVLFGVMSGCDYVAGIKVDSK